MSETVINVTNVRNGHNTPSHVDDPISNLSWIKFNLDYFLTIDGILKIIQFVSSNMCENISIVIKKNWMEWSIF